MSQIIPFPTGKVKNRKKSIQKPELDIKNDGSCICPKCGSTNVIFSPGSGIHKLRGDCCGCGQFFWVSKKVAEKLLGTEEGGQQ